MPRKVYAVPRHSTEGKPVMENINSELKAPRISYAFIARDKDGNELWREEIKNLVCTGGKTDIIDKYLKGSSYTAAWYMGLTGACTPAAGDTLTSHSGWTEATAYAGNRPAITWGTTTSGSNTGTGVLFTANAALTVAGAFVCTVATGTSGVLYSVAALSGSRTLQSGDTLTITPTVSAS